MNQTNRYSGETSVNINDVMGSVESALNCQKYELDILHEKILMLESFLHPFLTPIQDKDACGENPSDKVGYESPCREFIKTNSKKIKVIDNLVQDLIERIDVNK